MECQECHQRPATLHFTQIIQGAKTEVNVCEVCAKEKGYMTHPEEGYSLHNLLSGLFNFDINKLNNHEGNTVKQLEELQCTKCKLTFAEFKRVGKFGCAECYQTFSGRLDPILRRVHSGNIKHYGKIPKREGVNLHTKKQLETYRTKLQELIEQEAFEEAALVRDEIKDLENQQDHAESGDDI